MAATISSLVRSCLEEYNDLTANLQFFASKHGEEKYCILWEDELGRLRVWTANIGAHQTGQSSLDYRLRDASHIRLHIVKLLGELNKTLKDVEHLVDDDSLDVASNQSDSSGDSDVSIPEGPAAELSELLEDLINIIDCLYRMSMLVRRPARHDFLIEGDPENVARFEPYDISHVEEKFPKADPQIQRVLGAATTRRRKLLTYRRRHHEKLGKPTEMSNEQSLGALSEMSRTVATDFEPQDELQHEVSSVAGLSLTSYATSLGDGGGMTIPAQPNESSDGSPFECPYCFYIITVNNRRDWQNHVMGDILPYSCIFPDCPIGNRLFVSRHEWYGHLQKEHKVYSPKSLEYCVLCWESLKSSQEFERHVARHLQELALFILPRDIADDEDEIMDDPPNDDYFDHSTSVDQADLVEATQSTSYQSVAPSSTVEQSSSGAVAEPTAPDTQELDLESKVDSDSSQFSTEDSVAPIKSTFKIVIHLRDTSIMRIAKLDTGADLDVMSKRVADALGIELEPYSGEDIIPLGGRIRPLGQITRDWHVMERKMTYTTTFVVLEVEEFDILLGAKTISECGFYQINNAIW